MMTQSSLRAADADQPGRDPLSLWLVPEIDCPTFRLGLIAKVMDRMTVRQLAESAPVNFPEWRLLARVSRLGSATMQQIAEAAWVEPSEVSRAARSLIDKGLVRRLSSPTPRRAPLECTPKGLAVIERVSRSRTGFHESIMRHLSADDRAELDRLLSLLADALMEEKKAGERG
jgi:DNA-binding MarR family transcriptional regulator